MTIGSRVGGDGIPRLLGPFGKEPTGLFQGLGVLFIFDQNA